MPLSPAAFACFGLTFFCYFSLGQTPQPAAPTPRDRIAAFLNASTGAWTPAQIATMERLRDAALSDPYALAELRHLTDNIGPRISGSPEAQQAVEYVAAEMCALGAEVQLEKTSVPHWVRGAETGELMKWSRQAPDTVQKIVLTALGGSIATASEGLTAGVVVANSFDDLKRLPPGSAKGKILLFNERFDKQLAALGDGGAAYGQAVVYRGAGPTVAASVGAAAVLVRSVGGADYRLPHTGATYLQRRATQASSRRDHRRRCGSARESRQAGSGRNAAPAHTSNPPSCGELQRDRRLEGE